MTVTGITTRTSNKDNIRPSVFPGFLEFPFMRGAVPARDNPCVLTRTGPEFRSASPVTKVRGLSLSPKGASIAESHDSYAHCVLNCPESVLACSGTGSADPRAVAVQPDLAVAGRSVV